MSNRFWDGKTVHFVEAVTVNDRRSFQLGTTERTSRDLALALTKLKQTTLMLPPSVEEILTALNYVLVADPASVAAHSRMEASKGMEPAFGGPVEETSAQRAQREFFESEGLLPPSVDPVTHQECFEHHMQTED